MITFYILIDEDLEKTQARRKAKLLEITKKSLSFTWTEAMKPNRKKRRQNKIDQERETEKK